MEFSKSELIVMDTLWSGEDLDENGEIQALELYKILNKKYGWKKTSCYTYFSRLVEKGAVSRRYPKYTMKPIVSRDIALRNQRKEAIDSLFQGSILNFCRTFIKDNEITKEELEEMKELIRNLEVVDD